MRVKIGDRWYDSRNEPICIQVSPQEHQQIAEMNGPEGKYAVFPEHLNIPQDMMFAWMSEE